VVASEASDPQRKKVASGWRGRRRSRLPV